MSLKDDMKRLAYVFRTRGYLVVCVSEPHSRQELHAVIRGKDVQCGGVDAGVSFYIEAETTADDYIEQRRMAWPEITSSVEDDTGPGDRFYRGRIPD